MKPYLTSTYFLISLALWLVSCSESNQQTHTYQPESSDQVFVNVNVIPMTGEQIIQGQDVWVRNGKIAEIVPSGEIEITEGIQTIQGDGKYLMPGLAEMHAHIPDLAPDGDNALIKETLFLYLAGGITTIRGMLGQPYHIELKELVAEGEVLGPRIYTSGTSINGNSVPDLATADSIVRAHKNEGYDFLKIHPGLKREVFDEVVATAKEVGIPYAGHVPVDVGIRHAIASDYASIDHVDGYLEGLVPEDAGVYPNENGFFGYNFTNLASTDLIPELAQMTKEKGVAIVPTQALMERWTSTEEPQATISQPEMKYMSPRTREQWVQRKYSFQQLENYDGEIVDKFIDIRRQLIKALYDNDVLIVLGSDAPQIFNVPGFSIHHELVAMKNCGLSDFQSIELGTANPAKYFAREGDFGTIVKGTAADLILVNKNPLEDVTRIQDNAGVMVAGKWLSETEIEARLASIAENYAE